jgi:prohibitin 1
MRRRNHFNWKRLAAQSGFSIIIFIFIVILLWNRVIYTTPVGHASVIWKRIWLFSEAQSYGPTKEGLHVILPWNKFFTFDLRVQKKTQQYKVVTNEGLHLNLEISHRWRVVRDRVVRLNREFGSTYPDKLLEPIVRAAILDVISQNRAMDLFGNGRSIIQEGIYNKIVAPMYETGIGKRGASGDKENLVLLIDVLIENVELPKTVREAIENKLRQSELVEEYRFRLVRERLESQRKEVEAQGIRTFQEVVTPAISEGYLKWRGIEATLKLAQSENAKIVIIGNSETGLPLILDTKTETNLDFSNLEKLISKNQENISNDSVSLQNESNLPSLESSDSLNDLPSPDLNNDTASPDLNSDVYIALPSDKKNESPANKILEEKIIDPLSKKIDSILGASQ